MFRKDFNLWCFVMFVALMTGKVWGWIGHERVRILEQQPLVDSRLSSVRLSISLTISVIYNNPMLLYTMKIIVQQGRANMVVIFLVSSF
jgi:E3 ubiquitin-protein ligase synoviolin